MYFLLIASYSPSEGVANQSVVVVPYPRSILIGYERLFEGSG